MRSTRLPVIATVAILASGCASSPEQLSKPLEDAFSQAMQRGSSLVGRLLDAKGAELQDLVKSKDYAKAAQYLAEDKEFFKKNEDKYSDLIRVVVENVSEPSLGTIRRLDGILSKADHLILHQSNWPTLRSAIVDGRNAVRDFRQLPYVSESKFGSKAPEDFDRKLATTSKTLAAFSPKAFEWFDHTEGKSFFDAYPVTLRKEAFLDRYGSTLVSVSQKLGSPEKIHSIAQTYGANLSPAVKSQLGDAFVDAKLSANPTFFDKLDAIEDARSRGIPPSSRAGFRMLAASVLPTESSKNSHATALHPENTFEATVLSLNEFLQPSVTSGRDYLLGLVAKEATLKRRVVAKEEVRSKTKTGTRTRQNPDYLKAQNNVYRAEQALRNHQISSGRSQSIAAALLQGIAGGVLEASKTQAYATLQATSPTIDEPIYSAYSYTVSRIEVEKISESYFVIVDLAANTASVTPHTWSSKRTFRIGYGINEDDPDASSIKSRLDTEDKLDAYEKEAVHIKLQDLLQHAHRSQKPFAAVGDHKEFLAALAPLQSGSREPLQTARLENDPRFQSIVIVSNGRGGIGTGFFVEPNIVMTNHHVIDGSSLAEIQFSDGRTTLGKVTKVDIGRDLALIRVQDSGIPLRFYQGALRQGDSVDLLGHPKKMTFSLTRGVISAIRNSGNPNAPGGSQYPYIQTDASINPGNSGGPMMIGDRVVGINTMKRRDAEGIGFAIHYSEAQSFINDK